MGDMKDDFRALDEYRQRIRKAFGVPCPMCRKEQPKRQPTILEQGRRCKVHRPAYVDPRPEPTQEEINQALGIAPQPQED